MVPINPGWTGLRNEEIAKAREAGVLQPRVTKTADTTTTTNDTVSFLWPSNVQVYVCTALSLHLSMAIGVASTSWLV